MASLILLGTHKAKLFPLKKGLVTLGRSERCDMPLDHPRVSRLHASICESDHGPILCDLQSRNGTYVNGVRIEQQLLRNRDVIRLGNCELRYLETADEAAAVDQLTLTA